MKREPRVVFGFHAVLARLRADPASVLEIFLDESRGDEGGMTYRPDIHIQYSIAGRVYETWTYDIVRAHSSGRAGKQKILDRFAVGRTYPCWYDPAHPETAVLVRGFSWLIYLFMLIPLTFKPSGSGG